MVETFHSTNKPVFGENEFLNLGGAHPQVSLSCDWLTVTAPIEPKYQNFIKSCLIDLPQMFKGFVQLQSQGRDYGIILRQTISKNAWLQIEGCPKKKGSAFLRFSCQPTPLGYDGIKLFKQIADTFYEWGYNEFIAKARITRIDIAADCVGVHINDLGFLPLALHKSGVFLSAKDGIESVYIGSKKSAAQFNIYNKALKQTDVDGSYVGPPITRIERRLKGYRPFKLIQNLRNPFGGLNVTSIPIKLPHEDQDLVRLFALASKAAGLSAAFSSLSKPRKAAFRKAVKEQVCSWWCPEKVWLQWPHVLNGLGLDTGYTHGKPKLNLIP